MHLHGNQLDAARRVRRRVLRRQRRRDPLCVTPRLAQSHARLQPRDGLGDSFNALEGLIRELQSREDRAILEYDVSGFAGQTVTRAVFDGRVTVNNSQDNGPRTFDFLVYEGNGRPDLSDFEIDATFIGSGSYHPPDDMFFDFSFDVTSQVRTVIDSSKYCSGVVASPV